MQHRFKKLATSSPAEFDYVIIGTESTGSAIATGWARIGISITLNEYGSSDAGPLIQMLAPFPVR